MIEMKERKKGLARKIRAVRVCVCVCTARRIDLLLVRRGGRLVEVDWDRPVDRDLQWKPHCCVVAFPVCSRNCTLIKLPSSTYIIVSFLTSLSLSLPLLSFVFTRLVCGNLWFCKKKKKKKNHPRFARCENIFFLHRIIFNARWELKIQLGKMERKLCQSFFLFIPIFQSVAEI